MKYLLLLMFALGMCLEANSFFQIAVQAVLIFIPLSILIWKQDRIIQS